MIAKASGVKGWGFGLVMCLAGFVFAWLVKPEKTEIIELQSRKSSRGAEKTSSRIYSLDHEKFELLRGGKIEEVVSQLSNEELRISAEELMIGKWGGVERSEIEQVQALIMEWAVRDLNGSLNWARALENEGPREVAMLSISTVVSQSDPVAGLKLYCELDRITMPFQQENLMDRFDEAFSEIALSGEEELAKTFVSLPSGSTYRENGWEDFRWSKIDFPEGFDFQLFFESESEIGRLDLQKKQVSANLLSSWAKRDLSAASHYLKGRARRGEPLEIWGVLGEMEKREDELETQNFVAHVLEEALPEAGGQILVTLDQKRALAALDQIPDWRARYVLLESVGDKSFDGEPFASAMDVYVKHLGLTQEEFREKAGWQE